MQKEIDSCHIKNNLRRRLAGNLAGKSADSSSAEYSRTLPRLRLDLPTTLHHDASAGRGKVVFTTSGGASRAILLLSSVAIEAKEDAPRSIRRSRQTILNAVSLVARRMAHARFCWRKTKSDKITFSKSYFLPLKKLKKQAFF